MESTPATNFVQYTPAMASDSESIRRAMNANTIEDLIPDELKAAFEAESNPQNDQKPVRTSESTKDFIPFNPFNKSTPPPVQQPQAPSPAQRDKDIPVDDTYESNPDDLDLSAPDAVDKLIAGDLEALKPKKESAPVEFPWYGNENYKKIVNRAKNIGIKQEELDRLIEEASDTKVIGTANYTKSLEEKANEYTQELEHTRKELDRLRSLERATHFDLMPEVVENFTKPMDGLVKEMKKVLSMGGVSTPLTDLLNAPDRVSLVKMLEDENMDDQDLNRLSNYWRSYKELEYGYQNAKSNALTDMKSAINQRIPEQEIPVLMRESLLEFLKEEKYKYIDDAIRDGLEKHKDVTDIIGTANNNFTNIVKAISNPLDYSKNIKFLKSLAKHTLDAAHARNIEKKYYNTAKEVESLKQQRDKLAYAYKKLMSSGKGLSGVRGVAYKNASVKQDDSEVEKKYMDFLNNKLSIEDII